MNSLFHQKFLHDLTRHYRLLSAAPQKTLHKVKELPFYTIIWSLIPHQRHSFVYGHPTGSLFTQSTLDFTSNKVDAVSCWMDSSWLLQIMIRVESLWVWNIDS
ncbi:hypothetical protein CEXT_770171 [Caerostris extrusa]|uniref:Uncharacterized protein n=1 Tax=Caerostris extrusa TaxID=172846 RepID=A0AAV4PFR0_CAEEX|nr:hypothetical protein CEXT_770171 [Caerostris extrusa]